MEQSKAMEYGSWKELPDVLKPRYTHTHTHTPIYIDGFGGLVVSMVPKIAGSLPAEAVGFFGRKNPQHAFLQTGSKAICPMSQICGM
jgi:hypothetical protein